MNALEEKQTWPDAFDMLEAYAAEHHDIVATPQALVIPRELRASFYALVSRVQDLLCNEVLGAASAMTLEAARRCGLMKQQLVEMSDLVDFILASAIENLIADPQAALAKPLFSMILDVIQGRSDRDTLLANAQMILPKHNKALFRNAYEAWAYYGVVASLTPLRFYEVFSPDTVEAYAVSTGQIIAGSQVTSPERRIPEAVFETADGRFFAMKSEVARELDYYDEKIARRRDFSSGGNTVGQIAHRVLLIYQIADIESVPIIADRDKQTVLASDLMCEVLDVQEIEQSSYASQFLQRVCAVRSKRPVQVLCFDNKGAFPKDLLENKQIQAIERRTVGFSEDVLKDVAGLLL